MKEKTNNNTNVPAQTANAGLPQETPAVNLANVAGAKEEVEALTINNILLNPQVFGYLQSLSQMMASGGCTIPAHLQGNPGDCMAIIMQAGQWKMNPWAVAQKTHIISGKLGYEAQLVNAVVTTCGAISGNFDYEWFGPWENVIGKFTTKQSSKGNTYQVPAWTSEDEKGCGIRVTATLKASGDAKTLELLLSQATVRNSTLWASDPKQQLAYLAVKRWARLYAPGAIMGVYTPDELEDINSKPPMKNVTPAGNSSADKLKSLIGGDDKKEKKENTGAEAPSETPAEAGTTNGKKVKKDGLISDAQRKMLFAVMKENGVSHEKVKKGMSLMFGWESTTDIPADQFEKVINWIKAKCPGDEANKF